MWLVSKKGSLIEGFFVIKGVIKVTIKISMYSYMYLSISSKVTAVQIFQNYATNLLMSPPLRGLLSLVI